MKKALLICSMFCFYAINAQTELVFVYFKDKPNKAAFYANPTNELSQKSLDRRARLGISLNDQDAPLEETYIQNVRNLGFTVTDYSKWLNGVAVEADAAQIANLKTQTYVNSVESFIVHPSIGGAKMQQVNKFEDFNKQILTDFNYGNGTAQIDQINLRPLHVAGYTGAGVTIAVIDSGFPNVDTGSVYGRIRNNNQIKGGYNFISKNSDIYNKSLNNHGSYCLGVIASFVTNQYVGSAPDADFYLYATEDAANEIPQEQLYWIEAAEEADRKGVDVITTSLGYYEFDDTRYNLLYSDMTGYKSFIARGADIASDKGIFVVAANGNEALKPWKYLITPADNKKVFSIGGVSTNGNSSTFSSYGPNFVGDIKPDASAKGTSTAMGYNNSVTSSSGTSFATPLAAGGIACLIQASSYMSMDNIKETLRMNSSLYPSHNDQKGFGILNFGKALTQVLATGEPTIAAKVNIFPNPVKNVLNIQTAKSITLLQIYDSLGRMIKTLSNAKQNNVSELKSGIYFVKVKTADGEIIEKFIKE